MFLAENFHYVLLLSIILYYYQVKQLIPIPGSEVGTERPDPDMSPSSMNVVADDVSVVFYCWIKILVSLAQCLDGFRLILLI